MFGIEDPSRATHFAAVNVGFLQVFQKIEKGAGGEPNCPGSSLLVQRLNGPFCPVLRFHLIVSTGSPMRSNRPSAECLLDIELIDSERKNSLGNVAAIRRLNSSAGGEGRVTL